MRTKKNLVRLWRRANKDGTSYTYYLRYTDLDGKFHTPSLGHSDLKKAEKERLKKEKELQMGYCPTGSMRLSEFLEDCLRRTGDNIRESTKLEYSNGMQQFIKLIGNIDFKKVELRHGEIFRQSCTDKGDSPHTVAKKIRELKVLFQLAVNRKQLDENPLQNLKPPKLAKNKKIHTYSEDESKRLIKAASEIQQDNLLEWDLVITFALTTGLRKSEILNLVWSDIDFDQMTLTVSPKENSHDTWKWEIKDTDSRTLPLTEDVLKLLINLQNKRPAGYPYLFIPPNRYDRIQKIRTGTTNRKKKLWNSKDSSSSIINNFTELFNEIRTRAGIKTGTFHDLRRTAITNWFYAGLAITEVMRLAGHSKYETTLGYYLAVKDDLVDRARKAVGHQVSREMMERLG